MSVRAKFKVVSVTETESGNKQVKLQPVTGGSPENAAFFKWTPYGSIDMWTINPAAAEQFKPGVEFYVDFTPAQQNPAPQ